MLSLEKNKIIEFPVSPDKKFEHAFELFDDPEKQVEALNEFIKLIDTGHDIANYYVGLIYEMGGKGLEANLEKALFYYQQSAEEYNYVEGYLALARLYYNGIGVDRDYDQAFRYCALIDSQVENPIAWLRLGQMYQHGHGVEKNLKTARDYYLKVIDKGYVFGMTYLALLEQEEKHYLKSLWLRLRAGIRAFVLTMKDDKDKRLRYS